MKTEAEIGGSYQPRNSNGASNHQKLAEDPSVKHLEGKDPLEKL